MNWDREVDLVVAGAGAGGMAAALTARILGLDVLIAEKTDRVGGSTAISGGAVWLQSPGCRSIVVHRIAPWHPIVLSRSAHQWGPGDGPAVGPVTG